MGKKARPPLKEKRVAGYSPKIVPEQEHLNVEIVDGVTAVKERKLCSHFEKGFDANQLSEKIRSLDSFRCGDCREGVGGRKGAKGRAKLAKKGSGSVDSKSESKAIWVCLECGHLACGGVGLPTTAQSHAVRHSKQSRHPLVFQWENPQLQWCFPCDTLIPVVKTEGNGEKKDSVSEVVKMIKAQSFEQSSVDAMDVWIGRGSILSELDAEGNGATSLEGRSGHVVRGLVNLGNTCFFNSVMQNLLSMNKLRDYFLNEEASLGPLSIALKKLFTDLKAEASLRNAINPKSFFGSVCSNAPQFRGYQQQDSHELLRCLLDGLSNEELIVRKRKNASEEDDIPPKHGPMFVDSAFGGQISSTVCCVECGHSSTMHEPFLDLSLPVPMKKPPIKKVQPVSRAKKTKLPPKRGGKVQPKVKKHMVLVPAQNISNPSVHSESSCQTQSSSDNTLAPDSNVSSTVVSASGIASQNLMAGVESDSKQAVDTAMKQTASSFEDFWMDYVGTETSSDEHNLTSENIDLEAGQQCGDKFVIPNDGLMEACQGPSIDREPNQKPKRGGKVQPKVKKHMVLVPAQNILNPSVHSESSCQTQSSSDNTLAPDSNVSSTVVSASGIASQNLMAGVESDSKQAVDTAMKQTASSFEDFWMDYVGTETSSDEHNLTSENIDLEAGQQCGDKFVIPNDGLMEACQGPSIDREPNQKPKRGGKVQPKVKKNMVLVPAQNISNPSVHSESSCQTQSSSDNTLAPDSNVSSTVVSASGIASQNLMAGVESDSKQAVDTAMKQTASSFEDFWMDYVGTETSSDEHNLTSENIDLEAGQQCGDKFVIPNDGLMEACQGPSIDREPNQKPKRGGKVQPKVKKNMVLVPAQNISNPSVHSESSCQTQSSTDNTLAPDSNVSSTVVSASGIASQNLMAGVESDSKQAVDTAMKQTASSFEDFWMDYVGTETSSDDHNLTSENIDLEAGQQCGDKFVIPNDGLMEACQGPSIDREPNQKPDSSSVNPWEEEVPLQVQSSEVLLLPYREEGFTDGEIMKGEAESSSSIVGREQDEAGFDGIGDLFNEPEVSTAPVAGPSLPNEVAGPVFIAGVSSESDPDEVDDTDSPVSIESCLSHFVKPELLSNDNAWECENCSKILGQQRLDAKKKQAKISSNFLLNGGETQIQSESVSLDKDISYATKVINFQNGDGNPNNLLSSTPEVFVSGKDSSNKKFIQAEIVQTEMEPFISPSEERKYEMNVSHSSGYYESCNGETLSGLPADSCSVDETSDTGYTMAKDEQIDSNFSGNCESDVNEDEDKTSKHVNVKRDATKRVLIDKAPPILTIHLKRFSQDARGRLCKLNGHVTFRDVLDIGPYMDPRCVDTESYVYRLLGVVEHLGTMRGGHYIAYVRGDKRNQGKGDEEHGGSVWYYASDAHVREVSLEEVLRCDAYLLFYEKV